MDDGQRSAQSTTPQVADEDDLPILRRRYEEECEQVADENLPILREDGSFGLSEAQMRDVVDAHFALLKKLRQVDDRMVDEILEGEKLSPAMLKLYYQRVGLVKDKAAPDRPEMPDVPAQAIYAEAIKRGMLGGPQKLPKAPANLLDEE